LNETPDSIFSADGTLLCRENPEKVCTGLLSPLIPHVAGVGEKVSNREDATQIAFNKVHCVDVGVDEGG
jgi:hypothetical protein